MRNILYPGISGGRSSESIYPIADINPKGKVGISIMIVFVAKLYVTESI